MKRPTSTPMAPSGAKSSSTIPKPPSPRTLDPEEVMYAMTPMNDHDQLEQAAR